ncbi:sensor histidine kinase [Lacibacter sediminis]|uniref:histidine kinase n=1 Tax=Lacibacter sediminis TaxID=2760713 RepID=A0A7G5XKN8_9BACT|nr:sensor histidine kinase [Lacibacter sediminis]QNA46041.1 sensor histidine kinase [Lacibacter sediminis]
MLRKLYYTIAGTEKAFSFEHRIFNLTSFVLTVFSAQGTIFNSILGLHPTTIILGITGASLTLLTFYLSRFRKLFNQTLLVGFILATIFVLAPLFFYNGASLGPTIYLMVMILTALLLISPPGMQLLLCIIYAVSIISLLVLEYYNPDWIIPYSTNAQRIADYATSLLYTLFFTALVIWLFRRSYDREQRTITLQKTELETLYADAQEKNIYIQSLIRELHHRVKNNLQVVSSLMSLQSNRVEDEHAKTALQEGKTRVDAMAMIHQKLYVDNELAAVNMQDYLNQLTSSLAGSFGLPAFAVETTVQLPNPSMNIDRAVSIGLIVNELVTNACKHAFKQTTDPKLYIQLAQTGDDLQLSVADNGIGLKNNDEAESGFGLKLVGILVNQLDASMQVTNKPGTRYTIQMKAE